MKSAFPAATKRDEASRVELLTALGQKILRRHRFRWPQMLSWDDEELNPCPGATRAIDEFLADKPEKMLSLADGGGWFLKGARA